MWIVVLIAAAIAAGVALAAGGGGDKRVVSYCRVDPGPPLPGDVPGSTDQIIARAERVLRRDARNPQSPLAQVLAGSPYTVTSGGFTSNGEHGWHGRGEKVIGAIFDVRVDDPRPFDAIVPAARWEWPPGSTTRYSRRAGYVPYRAHMASQKGITSLFVGVDMRTRRVTEISGGVGGDDVWEPIPGHCPLPPESPGD
jgi:hypothetical protein